MPDVGQMTATALPAEAEGSFCVEYSDSFCVEYEETAPPLLEGIRPSQLDPLGEFSQMYPESDDEHGEGDTVRPELVTTSDEELAPGVFHTQLSELRDDDFERSQTTAGSSRQAQFPAKPVAFGCDGYVREKLAAVVSRPDPTVALDLIRAAKRIVVVAGAGISVSAGIPDFRSEGRGLYAMLRAWMAGERTGAGRVLFGGLKEWQLAALERLDEPESLFDLEYFLHDPHPFYAFLLATRLGAPTAPRFRPTPSHCTLAALPNLLLVFTQNIDTLETSAGIANVCYCHGSFDSVSCVRCHRPHSVDTFWRDLERYAEADMGMERSRAEATGTAASTSSSTRSAGMCSYADRAQGDAALALLPQCQFCLEERSLFADDSDNDDQLPLLKPDIVFFGESLPASFFVQLHTALPVCDLLIVTGSSMKVLPVASIPDLIPPHVPQILINREPILDHNFDLELLGEADVIWSWIARGLDLKRAKTFLDTSSLSATPHGDGRFVYRAE